MDGIALRFSIDLEAELKKITQKQHLNQVHFLVQLVRHALMLAPSEVRIRSDSQKLVLAQDGRGFPQEELDLILKALTPGQPETQQQALTRLEEAWGIAVLSLVINAPYLEIRTGSQRFVAQAGSFHRYPEEVSVQGYRLELRRSRFLEKLEKKELDYYCSGACVPIWFNGNKLNAPLQFPGQVLTSTLTVTDGRGLVGIPEEGELCHITLFKHGVRLGIKQYLPKDGCVFHAHWDSAVGHFESDYRRSIRNGEYHLKKQAVQLYRSLPKYFPQLSRLGKERAKKLLFGFKSRDWKALFGDVPLFHAAGKEFSLSLNDLEGLRRRFERLPYCPKPKTGVPAYIPRLAPEDVFFLRDRMIWELSLFREKGVGIRTWLLGKLRIGAKKSPAAIDPGRLSGEHQAFLAALNRDEVCFRFGFSEKALGVFPGKNGQEMVFFPHDHREVRHSLDLFRRHPEKLLLIKYRLLALAG